MKNFCIKMIIKHLIINNIDLLKIFKKYVKNESLILHKQAIMITVGRLDYN